MAIDKAIDSGVLDANLTTVAQAIRAKGGTTQPLAFPAGFQSAIEAIETGITPEGSLTITANGTYDVTDKAQAVVSVPVPNYRRWTGTITSTINGAWTFALLVEDEIIGQVAGLDSLLVRVTTDFSGNDAYTMLSGTAANAQYVINANYYQFIHRIGETAGVFSDRPVLVKMTATENLSVGQFQIVGNQLRWVVNSNNYAVRPCNYVVEMMW